MKPDDILFAQIGMAEEEKDFLWDLIVSALGMIFNENEMSELRKKFDNELIDAGRIEFKNKAEIITRLHPDASGFHGKIY